MRSNRLRAAQAELWRVMADDYGLVPELALDALMARADRGESAVTTPRLIDLLVDYELTVEQACEVAARLGDHPWDRAGRAAIEEVLDAWWQETLVLSPGEHRQPFGPDVVLGILVGYDAPLVRWLDPWLVELDGPGASHLATAVLDGLDGPAWVGKVDQADQVIGWARTETVINGLTLIGGTHLDDDVLSDVLDRLI
ncbi:MAG: hypothetical protein ACR2QK_16200 [Acidimicrobiales bacterium]